MLTANRHEESWRLTGFDISKAVSVMVYDSQYFSLFLVGYGWWETSMFMQRWCRINLDHLLHMHLWQYVKISSWCIYPAQSHMAKVIVTCIHLLVIYETIIHVFRSNQFNTNGCWCPGPHIAKTTAAMLLIEVCAVTKRSPAKDIPSMLLCLVFNINKHGQPLGHMHETWLICIK